LLHAVGFAATFVEMVCVVVVVRVLGTEVVSVVVVVIISTPGTAATGDNWFASSEIESKNPLKKPIMTAPD
jgi:hypothetical protein